MTARFIAKRPARGRRAQVFDTFAKVWIAGTSSEHFGEVEEIADDLNRKV